MRVKFNCGDSGLCIEPPGTHVHVAVWQLVLTGLCILAGTLFSFLDTRTAPCLQSSSSNGRHRHHARTRSQARAAEQIPRAARVLRRADQVCNYFLCVFVV